MVDKEFFFVNGQLTVEEKKQTTTIPWSVPIRMTDFIRPVKMTTQQVGEIWGKHSQEKKVDLRIDDVVVVGVDDDEGRGRKRVEKEEKEEGEGKEIRKLVKRLEERIHVECCEIIKEEAIMSGMVARTTGTQIILLHAQVERTTGKASVCVRSEMAKLSESSFLVSKKNNRREVTVSTDLC